MDLIYMNAAREDLGVLQEYDLDLAFGANENNFECKILAEKHCCDAGYFLYIEETDYGGIIDAIEVNTGAGELKYCGRTWHGIVESRIIEPLKAGETSTATVTVKTADASGVSLVGRYLTITGDANACIGFILSRIGLSALFSASADLAGVNINAYQFNRYTDAYSGLRAMLASAGLKLRFIFTGGHVVLSAVPKVDYTQIEEFDSDQVDFVLGKKYKTVNHLICLGSGELENRMVRHLYVDANGNISATQTQTGIDDYTEVFDYPSAESEEELVNSGTERLKELMQNTELTVECDETADSFDVGDKVGAYDNVTGIQVAAQISKKIVTIINGTITIQYEVGE